MILRITINSPGCATTILDDDVLVFNKFFDKNRQVKWNKFKLYTMQIYMIQSEEYAKLDSAAGSLVDREAVSRGGKDAVRTCKD
jgi:hypothetical protein